MWTGDYDSDEECGPGLKVSWRCVNDECEVRFVDVHWLV